MDSAETTLSLYERWKEIFMQTVQAIWEKVKEIYNKIYSLFKPFIKKYGTDINRIRNILTYNHKLKKKQLLYKKRRAKYGKVK